MKTLSIDIESFSSVNLQKSGVYRYSESEDFEVLLFAYSVDGQPVQVVDLACGEVLPQDVLEALTDETVEKWAFNATFERVCLSRFLGLPFGEYLNPSSWRCTMIWAATLGLPLSLDGVGAVLGLDKQKMSEGKNLIRYFCVPCSPTKVNGGRSRNLPSDDKEKWEQFKTYNIRDVEVEKAIQEKLSKFPVSDEVWNEYHQDQEINDRGIGLDTTLVESAIELDKRSKEEITARLQKITGLENPNSVIQLREWLRKQGLEVDSLDKKAVNELIKTSPLELIEVFELRQQLAKSSVKKYQAMTNAACNDKRAHGMFQFYGANRTGRFAGRLIQLQNLPQNHMTDLAEARESVRKGDYEALSLLYENLPKVLSELIRTAFVPQDGMKFIVSDFSAIEARVIAWLAREHWREEVFRDGGDDVSFFVQTHHFHTLGATAGLRDVVDVSPDDDASICD